MNEPSVWYYFLSAVIAKAVLLFPIIQHIIRDDHRDEKVLRYRGGVALRRQHDVSKTFPPPRPLIASFRVHCSRASLRIGGWERH